MSFSKLFFDFWTFHALASIDGESLTFVVRAAMFFSQVLDRILNKGQVDEHLIIAWIESDRLFNDFLLE